MHGERDAVFALELRQWKAERIEPFGARAFQESQIVRVIDDACGIGVFVINANGEREAAQRFRDRRRGRDPPPAWRVRSAGTQARWRCDRATSVEESLAGSGRARERLRSCRAPRR